MTRRSSLGIGGRLVEATVVTGEQRVDGRTIVVNLSPEPLQIDEEPASAVPPFASTVLIDAGLVDAASALLLRPVANAAQIVDEPGWASLADLLPGFPDEVLLLEGPQEDAGTVTFDPGPMLGNGSAACGPAEFAVRLNLWFAPAATDCVIHNEHAFVEIHTQVLGTGRMQKFRRPDPRSLYQEVELAPGTTHAPFGSLGPAGFVHPWHQYHAETDCVWLAVEYHPTTNGGS